jgi:hypothetical protein
VEGRAAGVHSGNENRKPKTENSVT